MLNISKQLEENVLTVHLAGRIDTNTAPTLQAAVDPVPAGVTKVVLDFDGIDYISSAGLRVLLALTQELEENDGRLELCHVNSLIMDVFDVTGFLEIMNIV